ncbi:hypothetical protein KUTeg_009721 [Tegillarca granosa]|uniref:Uncharacterized protein n=1 Tax=Tegillarca granosa TaxID=220873 RepID=A0ABQ9F4P8_TEGGR|nr:hypothetical protein KUTeg_009721 [Tegillarca granosa]
MKTLANLIHINFNCNNPYNECSILYHNIYSEIVISSSPYNKTKICPCFLLNVPCISKPLPLAAGTYEFDADMPKISFKPPSVSPPATVGPS